MKKKWVYADTYVYFMRDPKTGWIKIGFSQDPTARVDTLNVEFKTNLEILGMMPGSMMDEKKMHHDHLDLWIEREWFQDHDRIRSIVANDCITLEQFNVLRALEHHKDDIRIMRENFGRLTKKDKEAYDFMRNQRVLRATGGKMSYDDWIAFTKAPSRPKPTHSGER